AAPCGCRPAADRPCGRRSTSDRAHGQLLPLRASRSRSPLVQGALASLSRPFVGGLGHNWSPLLQVWHSEEWLTPLCERHHEDKQAKKNA
ncbi:hypothetical protein BHM03_00045351, partial [Ensete ventricosum]